VQTETSVISLYFRIAPKWPNEFQKCYNTIQELIDVSYQQSKWVYWPKFTWTHAVRHQSVTTLISRATYCTRTTSRMGL